MMIVGPLEKNVFCWRRFLVARGLGRREEDFIGRAAQVRMKRRETD